jgi:DNA polymerase V
LRWLKIEDVWGIGRQHARRLMAQQVYTAYDFTQLPDEWVKKNMSVIGWRLKQDLMGIPTLTLEEAKPKKNIATTRSFETNYTDLKQLEERISTFAASCAEKLRRQQSCCSSIMVFIHSNGHRKDLPQYSRNIVIQLPFPTNSTIELSTFATQALKRIFKEGYAYKKAGVIVQDFTPEESVQTTLFETRDERHIPLMKTIDQLNLMFGQQKIRLASQDPKRIWKMKQEKLSPRYTTNLEDVINIHV